MIKLGAEGQLFFILEPGNITMLQRGEPLSINLREMGIDGEIVIAWTPDPEWMTMEIAKAMPIHVDKVFQLIEAGLSHEPHVRLRKPQ